MDHKEEYHDPDYAGTAENVKEEPPSLSEDERIEKIKRIIRREFSNELEVRENEVMLIDQRMTTSRRLLHRLRYALVNSYYREQKLQLSAEQVRDEITTATRDECDRSRKEMSTLLREGQRRLHPSVRKLLGKRTADLSEIFKTRQPRSRPRPDYSAMLQIRNYTIAADSTKSLRPERTPPAPPAAPLAAPLAAPPPATQERPKKLPRHIEPKVEKVVTLDEQTRNKVKHRYRIVIGNTSKYAPPASRADRSTHKWLLYVRDYTRPGGGGQGGEGIGGFVKAVTARLHHSYSPHHTVTLYKPPFHISRRGWGEFTARIELHFALPDLNPPATVSHDIKLDRNYTGLQTLGAETIVDVWLYSSPEMLKHAYVDDNERTDEQTNTQTDTQTEELVTPKQEPLDSNQDDSWMDFFSRDTTEMDVDDMIIKPVKAEPDPDPQPEMEEQTQIKEEPMDFDENLIRDGASSPPGPRPASNNKRIMKYMEPATGKVFYLELDRDLDLSSVQEIVFSNSTAKVSPVKNGLKAMKKKRQVSLLKPEVKNSLRTEQMSACFRHIENDHCYLGAGWSSRDEHSQHSQYSPDADHAPGARAGDAELAALRAAVDRLSDVRSAVYFLLRRVPLVDARAADAGYQKCFPFVVESDERYWKLDFAKRRNIEWSRAKLITRLLSSRPCCWRTKQVLSFARLHGFHPVRPDPAPAHAQRWDDWTLRDDTHSNIKQLYQCSDINSLSLFQSDNYKSEVTEIDLVDSDEEVDIVGSDPGRGRPRGVSEGGEALRPLPQDEQDRMKFLFLERVCADVGVELRNEDVGHGYSYSAVHAVLLSALRSFAEELLRVSLAASRHAADPLPHIWRGWSSSRGVVSLEHVYQAAGGPPPPAERPAGSSGPHLGSHGPSGSHGSSGYSGSGRLRVLSARSLAAVRKNSYAV